MIAVGPEVRQRRVTTRGRVTCFRIDGSLLEVRSCVSADDEGRNRLTLGIFEMGRRIAELRFPLRSLPSLRNAMNAAIDAAMKAQPPSHDGRLPEHADGSSAPDTKE